MKTLLTTASAAILVTLATLLPASAGGDSQIQLDKIDSFLAQSQQAIIDLNPGHGAAVVELMPAIQKIREAKNRMMQTCGDPTTGGMDAACAASELSEEILDSGQ